MNYFLVDYENVKVSGFDGLTALTEKDVVIIFYSEKADNMTFGLYKRINESKANFQFQKVTVGEKNALDFQLCTYLGYLIRDNMAENKINNECVYYIVSNDKGYIVLSEYWKRKGINVTTVGNLKKSQAKPPEENKALPTPTKANISELEQKLKTILPDKTDVAEVAKIINHYKTKQGVNNGLTKKFPTQKVGHIYKAIKPLIADKKGS